MNCIALVARAGTGKTTIADEFVDKLGYTKLSFAAPIKCTYRDIFGYAPDHDDPADRTWMQNFGSICRAVDEDVFIKLLVEAMQGMGHLTDKFIVDDCRYRNEAAYLRSVGFIIVKLVGRQRSLSAEQKSHASESEVDLIEPDLIVDNSGTVQQTMDELLRKLKLLDCGQSEIKFYGENRN